MPVRAAAVAIVLVPLLAGCAELGVMTDGTSISVGKPNRGYLIDGAKLPDTGDGFTTAPVWIQRDNRYGTDELIALVTGVAKRMAKQIKDVRIVIADLSSKGGGGSFAFHRSHQSGRDADFLYYMRDSAGNPVEPDAMHVFDGRGRARDKSGLVMDVPRTWQLVKELVDAPEATVQYIFIYEPIAQLLIDHAKAIGEPMDVIVRARRAMRQPGDSARHDDHMHVRVYCAADDRPYGCEDIGPMDLLVEREHERAAALAAIAAALPSAPPPAAVAAQVPVLVGAPAAPMPAAAAVDSVVAPPPPAFGSLLRAGPDRIDLRGWR